MRPGHTPLPPRDRRRFDVDPCRLLAGTKSLHITLDNVGDWYPVSVFSCRIVLRIIVVPVLPLSSTRYLGFANLLILCHLM
jgi:hypothetical protein